MVYELVPGEPNEHNDTKLQSIANDNTAKEIADMCTIELIEKGIKNLLEEQPIISPNQVEGMEVMLYIFRKALEIKKTQM
jgi:hypothetical protein